MRLFSQSALNNNNRNDLITGEQVEPASVGIIDAKGPDDKQPFMVAFFKATQEVKSRRTRGAGRRHQRTEVTYNDEPSQRQWSPHVAGNHHKPNQ